MLYFWPAVPEIGNVLVQVTLLPVQGPMFGQSYPSALALAQSWVMSAPSRAPTMATPPPPAPPLPPFMPPVPLTRPPLPIEPPMFSPPPDPRPPIPLPPAVPLPPEP